MKELISSIERLLEMRPKLREKVRGLPDLGKKLYGEDFSCEVRKMQSLFNVYGNELHELDNEYIKNLESRSLGGGSPMKSKSFPPCKEALKQAIDYEYLSEYPLAAGDEMAREEIVGYLNKEGFKSRDGLNKDNVIFTVSTTHAFATICNLIARPYDVVLMTGPNYGLFAFVPERSSNATVEILPLSAEDDWYVNPGKLSKKIDEINDKLKLKYGNTLSYIPRVVAFLNENPHNPLGKVMNNSNKHILEGIGNVCLEKGVFVIDDLIYRDLTYDRENLALPMATYDKYFDNTITLMGLSKSYGLASLRAGMVVANPIICRGIRDNIFQTMDSSPVIQGKALAGAFNSSDKRYEEYDKYFNPMIKEYKYRLQLLKSMIEGIDSISDPRLKSKIENDVRKYLSNDFNINDTLEGIPGVKIADKTFPDSGFFVMLDFTELKNKKGNNRIITNEIELLKYMYECEKIKLILGQSISWPNPEQLIGRVTTALEKEELVDRFGAMNKCLRKLK